ncbi:hypothetical protein [Teretinema zuelzerae]|nr:hypothetical protein [Teretinema zuelzerae]
MNCNVAVKVRNTAGLALPLDSGYTSSLIHSRLPVAMTSRARIASKSSGG